MGRKTAQRLFEEHYHDLYRYLYSLSKNHHAAEDLLQEVFLRAYLHLEHYQGERVKPWLFKVAYNAFIDEERKGKRQILTESDYFNRIPGGESPESQALYGEMRETLQAALDRLSSDQKQAFILHHFHEFSYLEAAEVMNTTVARYKVLLFRGRQRIRTIIEEREG